MLDVKKVFKKELICLSCSMPLRKHRPLNGQYYKYRCTNKERKHVYKVEKNDAGLYYIFPHIVRKKFKYKKFKDVPETKLKTLIACLKFPFGKRKKGTAYRLPEDLKQKIYTDNRKEPRLFNIASLRRKNSRKNTVKLVELIIKKGHKKHLYWKHIRSPRIWYNIYCSEKKFILGLNDEDKAKLIQILTTIKRKKWSDLKKKLKDGIKTYKKTRYERFYNYRSINTFFGNKNVPNFEKLVNEPKPQNVNRIKK